MAIAVGRGHGAGVFEKCGFYKFVLCECVWVLFAGFSEAGLRILCIFFCVFFVCYVVFAHEFVCLCEVFCVNMYIYVCLCNKVGDPYQEILAKVFTYILCPLHPSGWSKGGADGRWSK